MNSDATSRNNARQSDERRQKPPLTDDTESAHSSAPSEIPVGRTEPALQAAADIGAGIPGSEERSSHTMSTAAFWLGVLSIFIGGDVVAVPLVAALLGLLGLIDADSDKHKNRWMAGVGLVLGAIYTLAYLYLHGHM